MPPSPQISTAYQPALDSAAVYQAPAPGLLRFSGETRIDYLQRQTSNDLGLLSTQRAVPSLLTSAQGRVLEVFTLVQDGEGLLMATQPGHGHGLAEYFRKRIFFNDQVAIDDLSAGWAAIEIHGPLAAQALGGLSLAPAAELDGLQTASWHGHRLHLLTQAGFGAEFSYRLLAPEGAAPALLAELALPALDNTDRELLRIEASLAGDPEFNHQYTPFELGLDRLVSTDKGCYTGQEVLARQVTYDKVVRKLARLRAGAPLAPGQRLLVEGKPAGEVSSAAVSPRLGPLALAVLRRPHNEAGTRLAVEGGGEAEVSE